MNALHVSRSADLPPMSGVTELAQLWAWTLPLALLGSWTCFGAVPGVNWALWTAATSTGFTIISRRSDRAHTNSHPRAALALACLLAIAAAITANPAADALIFLSVASLLAFAVLAVATQGMDIGPSGLVRAPLDVCRLLLSEAGARVSETFTVLRMRRAVPVVRGGTMAMVLAAVLFLLLSAADPTFADWRDLAWRTVLSRMFLARDAFFVVLAMLLLGGYGLAARMAGPGAATQTPGRHAAQPPTPGVGFSDIERLMVLGAALTLFLVFFGLELSPQLAASGAHLAAGETFAEATHRGFGEMIVAAALCALVIITLDECALRGSRERAIRLLSWCVIAASLVIVASAYQRVRYYEAAYGYTEQRLYVQVICGLVSLALLALAWELRAAINVPRLIRHGALIAAAGVACVSYWNNAAWIVAANVGRYETTGKIDASYLERLARTSPDAIPALVAALPKLAPADAARVRQALQQSPLEQSILVPPGGAAELSWYEWSLRRAAAQAALRKAGLLDGAAPR